MWAVLALALCTLVSCTPALEGEGGTCAPAEEERLVVYTSHKQEVWWPIVKEFEERTGIWVDVVTGGSSELLQRIAKEEQSPRADVMFGGGVESLASYEDCFAPYTSQEAEAIPEQFQDPDGLWTPFSSLPVVLIYNTKLVGEGQVTRWSDLLSPYFQGKIAFSDPAVSGSSYTSLVTMICALGGDAEENLHRFAANLDGRQLESSGDVLTSVADGTDWVGVTLEETALKRIAAGDDIAMVYPTDGTSSVPDGSALVRGAPHEENAKRFLDFTISRDVQQLVAEQSYRRPVRRDVEPAEELADLEELLLVDYNVDWASQNRENLLMSWAFFLGGEEEA